MLDADGHVQGYRGGQPTSDEVERSPERVFRPGRKNPVALRANSNGLFLLQKLRDEAHRFAIGYHKKLRSQATVTSALDNIPGVGPTRRKALLRHFGSLSKLEEATVEEIATVPGIGPSLALEISRLL